MKKLALGIATAVLLATAAVPAMAQVVIGGGGGGWGDGWHGGWHGGPGHFHGHR